MKRTKIVIVGGGSVAWTPHVVKDMLLTPRLQDAEYVLYDTKPAAARLTARFLEKLNAELGTRARIVPTDDRAAAFKGADYYVITVSTGGLDAMARDVAIPEDYGIYHTVGDTSGPGGWARAIRNFGVFRDLGQAIEQHSPGAMVLNYTNPMTFLTDVLARTCAGPVVGLCHGVFENLAFIRRYYGLASEDDLAVTYSGLNHFFWISGVKAGKRDLLADLREKIRTKTFEQLGAEVNPDPMGYFSRRDLATELFRMAGIMPYLGDRHTCEFMAPYLASRKILRECRIERTTIDYRKKAFRKRRQGVRDMVAQDRLPESYHTRSRESAADILAAHLDGKPFTDVGNVPNIGQMPQLPAGTVVETPVLVDGNGFTPLPQPPLPEVVVAFLEPCAHAANMTVRACMTGDRELALQALRVDPNCAHLTNARVREMGTRLLKAHGRWITCF